MIVYGSRLRFLLNPDFPQDTRALFEALCNVHTITIDGEPFIPHPTSKEVAS